MLSPRHSADHGLGCDRDRRHTRLLFLVGDTTLKVKNLALALQGGGSHGAFTWGALERLLEDERITIEGISGTSAGAMNAAVLADGYTQDGRDGAIRSLDAFWRAMSAYGSFNPYRSGLLNPLGPDRSPLSFWLDILSYVASPYQLNPFNINPLRKVLANTLDFECLQRCSAIKLFISATNVRTNRLRIFTNQELSVDALLASACLPQIHHTVQVNGDYYWDGGYTGNPVLEPLVNDCQANDVLIVQINPTHRERIPMTAQDIADRLNEITFNSNLMREIRHIAEITRLIEAGVVKDPRFHRTYFHLVHAEDEMKRYGVHTKYDTAWPFLTRLRDLGRARTDAWLDDNYDSLGTRSTLPLKEWAPRYWHRTAATGPNSGTDNVTPLSDHRPK